MPRNLKPCRSPCGERGLKYSAPCSSPSTSACRSSCGERGLKSPPLDGNRRLVQSLPVRGAWIEMEKLPTSSAFPTSRSPCGERGLKFCCLMSSCVPARRSPCGERGLKWLLGSLHSAVARSSLPVRGAWIEMPRCASICPAPAPSLPVRGAWIEIFPAGSAQRRKPSLPVRGAWIEIAAAG